MAPRKIKRTPNAVWRYGGATNRHQHSLFISSSGGRISNSHPSAIPARYLPY
ncbi:MAG: hypothetical protein ACR2KX_03360 [Chitinophagaceae bacterium]